jgi:hypothetical protein
MSNLLKVEILLEGGCRIHKDNIKWGNKIQQNTMANTALEVRLQIAR